MNMLLAIFVGIALAGGATLYVVPWLSEVPIPQMKDVYWGPGDEPKTIDTSIRPFKIVFEKEMVDDLRHRLERTRQPLPSLENVGWTYGVNSKSVVTIIDYWLNKYDFKKREAHLNQYPQFITNIQGLDIHFIHVKPQLPKNSKIQVVPLYIQHGWPGSVVEFYKMIPMLTTPRADRNFVFEVIAPSLPGFAYSQAASKVGLGAIQMAHLMKNLMLRLGFDKFYIQGGDWGANIGGSLAAMYPQHVLGFHSNMCMVLFRPMTWLRIAAYSLMPSLLPVEDRELMYPLKSFIANLIRETGYLHLQATKPDTLGVGVSDSPTGLAAYILEKFISCIINTNKHAEYDNLLEKLPMDEYIDNIMMYWVPNKATTSFRIYSETLAIDNFKHKIDNVPIRIPTSCAKFPDEIVLQPTEFLRDKYVNLLRVTSMPRGSHFAAFEEPQLLADDIWASVQEFRDYHAAQEKQKLENQKS